jgi:hypothetical protein
MLLSKLDVVARLLLAAGVLAAGVGLLPPLQVVSWGQADAKKDFPTPAELAKLAAVIKPKPEETKWQQIPWITDVSEGRRLAKAENRPLCLVVIFGELLDEC